MLLTQAAFVEDGQTGRGEACPAQSRFPRPSCGARCPLETERAPLEIFLLDLRSEHTPREADRGGGLGERAPWPLPCRDTRPLPESGARAASQSRPPGTSVLLEWDQSGAGGARIRRRAAEAGRQREPSTPCLCRGLGSPGRCRDRHLGPPACAAHHTAAPPPWQDRGCSVHRPRGHGLEAEKGKEPALARACTRYVHSIGPGGPTAALPWTSH